MPLTSRSYESGVQKAQVPQGQEDWAALLAELLSAQLGVTVERGRLVTMFERHWRRLSALAHAVHDDLQRKDRS